MNELLIPIPEPRIAEFEKLGFGMFIHYGLYSTVGCGEKIMHFRSIPNEEYRKLMQTFTAEKFSGRELARLAKAVGMKYICLTARHHDGFSLFDTCGLNDYDAPHSAAKRDLIADFVEGCNAEGVIPFLYHTTLDWYDQRFQADFPAYLDYLNASVELLCKNYGKIGGFWFDGNWARKDVDWQEDRLYKMMRAYQPEAILINNTGMSRRGAAGNPELDSVTFENGRPTPMDRRGMEKYLAAEMCETMSDYWGYAAEDCNYKSSARLIESLCSCRKVGANYLLNVGPMGSGEIAEPQRAILNAIGHWRKTANAPLYSVYPCGASCTDEKSFVLRAGDEGSKIYYLYVFGLCRADTDGANGVTRNGVREFVGMPEGVKTVRWLDNDETLEFQQSGDRLSVICTGFPYGKSLVIRVAEVTVE